MCDLQEYPIRQLDKSVFLDLLVRKYHCAVKRHPRKLFLKSLIRFHSSKSCCEGKTNSWWLRPQASLEFRTHHVRALVSVK